MMLVYTWKRVLTEVLWLSDNVECVRMQGGFIYTSERLRLKS